MKLWVRRVAGFWIDYLIAYFGGVLAFVGVALTIQQQNADALNIGRNVDEIIRILKAAQTGGQTACNWQDGDQLIS